MTETSPFALASFIVPLRAAPLVAELDDSWTHGPWDLDGVTVAERRRMYHAGGPIELLASEGSRAWRPVNTALGPGRGSVVCAAVELVQATLAGRVRAYLIAHCGLEAGPLGGTASSLDALSRLVRLESPAAVEWLAAQSWGASLQVERSYLRAVTVVGVIAPTTSAPGTLVSDPVESWLAAGIELKSKGDTVVPALRQPAFHPDAGVIAVADSTGLSVVSEKPGHLDRRTLRAHYVDAALIATVQRDLLLELSKGMRDLRPSSWYRPRFMQAGKTLRAFDEFRRLWWHPAAVDHPRSRALSAALRNANDTPALMAQLTDQTRDRRDDLRILATQHLAVIALLVSVVVGLIGIVSS